MSDRSKLKKPFFHAYPGALAYSFGMMGCDLHCSYCQNWVTSQALRDPNAVSLPLKASPEALVEDALRQRAKVLVSTYNEPLITAEWAVAIFKEAKSAGVDPLGFYLPPYAYGYMQVLQQAVASLGAACGAQQAPCFSCAMRAWFSPLPSP